MTRFEEIMETVFKWEGGYIDHPDDPGGATNYGITHEVLADWRGVTAVSKREVRNMTKEEAREIFSEKYFKVIRGSELPEPIDLIVMDGAVNHGTRTMAKFVQSAIGRHETGTLTDEDLKDLNEFVSETDGLVQLAVVLADARRARYRSRPHAANFIRGWTNRLNDVMSQAFKDFDGAWTFARGYDSGAPSRDRTDPDPINPVIRPVIEDEELQAALATWGDYDGEIDGMFGPISTAATDKALERNASVISGDWRRWSLSRKKIAIGQLICRELDLNVGRIDGLFGPLSEEAFLGFNRKRLGLPEDAWRNEIDGPTEHKPILTTVTVWPRQRDLASYFGNECMAPDRSGSCGPGGVRLKRLQLPYKMKIAWDLGVELSGFSINEKVHDSAARVFDKIYREYGDDGVEELGVNLFGGCYNCRRIKGGSRCSTHSWGIAIDFDPSRNQLRWNHRQARLAKPDAVRFWEFWEEEGWVSLGRARDFDWMHVQAARL